ncbi:MAG: ribonuclease HII [Candidatus Bathyarchaeota archaeon]|nr:MAG: ribonuclease HII [Candidatus Bathyarchaeota archaeon]
MARVAGVDEAGRGCVIGPLVVAGVLMEEDRIEELRSMGVRDSKKLSPKRRETLALEIKEISCKLGFFELQPWAIDKVVERGVKLRRLNYLEAMAMARVIRDLRPDRVYVDPADVVAERFCEQIRCVLPWEPEIVCENKADDKYPVVSAASILAKVRRDRIVADLRRKHGDFGSGYPSDGRTTAFLESWFSDNPTCPPFIRGSWVTVRRLRES